MWVEKVREGEGGGEGKKMEKILIESSRFIERACWDEERRVE